MPPSDRRLYKGVPRALDQIGPGMEPEIRMNTHIRLLLWSSVALIVFALIAPLRRGRHNCMTWAISEFERDGGYLVIRWCRSSRFKFLSWPHFLYLPKKHHVVLLQYTTPGTRKTVLPRPFFKGEIVQGDYLEESSE